MAEREVRVIYSFGERPAEAPGGWLIWNAPRPLHASQRADHSWAEWDGSFRHGIFYTATDPQDAQRSRLNAQLDGYLVEYVDVQTAVAEARGNYEQQYGAEWIAEVLAGFEAPEAQRILLEKWDNMHERDTRIIQTDK